MLGVREGGQCDYQQQHKEDFSGVMGLFCILIVMVVSTSTCIIIHRIVH